MTKNLKLIVPNFIIFFPYINYYSKNIYYIDFYNFFYLLISFFFSCISIYFLSYIISSLLIKFQNKNFHDYKLKIFFVISIFFTLAFFHEPLTNNFGKLASYCILFSLSIFTYYLNSTIFKKIFLIILISYVSIFILNIYGNKISNQKSFELKEISKFDINENIYYVILDGMTSLSYMEKFSNISENEEIKKLEELGLIYIKDSYSSYNMTPLSMASLINTDYPILPADKKFSNYDNFFPNIIYKYKNFNNNIIGNLNLNKKKFKYIQSSWAKNNSNLNYDILIDERESKIIKIILPQILINFYNPSFFDGIVHKFVILFLGSKKDILSDNYYQNDSIGRFLKYLEKNKLSKTKTFYLIHQISPHRPYIFKSNCDKALSKIDQTYINSYKCSLKKIRLFTQKLKKLDPGAVIVFQGDHGWKLDPEIPFNKFYISKDQFKIFNAIILPDRCNLNDKENPLDNVKTINLVLSCSSNTKYKKIKMRNFYSLYKDDKDNQKEFGKVYEIDVNSD